MPSKREIVCGLSSVALHVGLLAWILGQAPPTAAPVPPAPVEVELVELTPPTPQPLALRADGGPEHAAPSPAPPRGEETEPEPRSLPEPAPPRPLDQQAPEPTPPDEPSVASDPVGALEADAVADPVPPATSESQEPSEEPDGARPSGTPTGAGSMGAGHDGLGTHGTPDHSAYGAELVRLVMSEIDENPVPGLGPKDSVEVELEVLPSGRLARWGLGKYDYARVVRSTLGPLRLRAILRRILRASQGFPPHPSSFPRQRYVVGITVRFRDLHG